MAKECYVFKDGDKWKCVYEGKTMLVEHDTEKDALENLESLRQLDGSIKHECQLNG